MSQATCAAWSDAERLRVFPGGADRPILPVFNEGQRLAILALLIVGIAAGFIATRVMGIDADILTTASIGILGTLAGFVLLRLFSVFLGAATWAIAAAGGAFLLAWAYKAWQERR